MDKNKTIVIALIFMAMSIGFGIWLARQQAADLPMSDILSQTESSLPAIDFNMTGWQAEVRSGLDSQRPDLVSLKQLTGQTELIAEMNLDPEYDSNLGLEPDFIPPSLGDADQVLTIDGFEVKLYEPACAETGNPLLAKYVSQGGILYTLTVNNYCSYPEAAIELVRSVYRPYFAILLQAYGTE